MHFPSSPLPRSVLVTAGDRGSWGQGSGKTTSLSKALSSNGDRTCFMFFNKLPSKCLMPLKINWVLLKALFPVTDLQFGPPGMLDMPVRCRLSIRRAILNLEHTLGIRLNAFSDSQIVLKLTSYKQYCLISLYLQGKLPGFHTTAKWHRQERLDLGFPVQAHAFFQVSSTHPKKPPSNICNCFL